MIRISLGATLPLDGYGIENLSVSEDGSVLLGQLQGLYSTPDPFHQQPNQNAAWNVAALIAAATDPQHLANRLSRHIELPADAQQSVITPDHPSGSLTAPVGTVFDPDHVRVQATGNLGDVIGVDLKRLAAIQLLEQQMVKDGKLTEDQLALPLASLPTDIQTKINGLIPAREQDLSDFQLSPSDVRKFATEATGQSLRLVAVKQPDGTYRVVSTDQLNGTHDGDFANTGILYFVPNIDPKAEASLRAGGNPSSGFDTRSFNFTFKDAKAPDQAPGKGVATVTADDYAKANGAVFFGDRPLKDPGYSAFSLSAKGQSAVLGL